jgi:fimbrial chaperone protein
MLNVFFVRRGIVAALAVSVVALVASPSSAAIGVTPLNAILAPGATSASFTITNPETVERIVQPQVFRWEHVNGKDQLTKSSDWIVNPPIASIAPLGQRVVRMAMRHRVASTEETAYRLILTEVNAKEATGVGVAVNTNLSLPIFLEPAGVSKKKPEWSAARGAAHQIVVTLKNTTAVHVHVSRFVLRDPSGKTLQVDAPSYVFAGESRSWTLVLDKSAPDSRSLVVEANLDEGVQTIPIGDR